VTPADLTPGDLEAALAAQQQQQQQQQGQCVGSQSVMPQGRDLQATDSSGTAAADTPRDCAQAPGHATALQQQQQKQQQQLAPGGASDAHSRSNLVGALRSFLPAKRPPSPLIAAGKKAVKVVGVECVCAWVCGCK